MSLTALAIAALFAQAAPIASVPAPTRAAPDVAYGELARGDAQAAVRKLELMVASSPDPAALINLGNAYRSMGKITQAMVAYQAAADSPQRYELELADGSWMDSRNIARAAIAALQGATALASR